MLLKSDSKLVIRQIKGEYEAKEGRIQKYLRLTNHLIQEFDQVDFVQVPQIQNSKADKVARQASSKEGTRSLDLKVEVQKHPSNEGLHTFAIQDQSSWIAPIFSFLQDGRLLADEARKIKKQAAKFTILNDVLYKRDSPCPT